MLLYPHVIFSVCLSFYIGKRISKVYLLSGVGFIHLGVAYSRLHVAEICIDSHIFPCLYRNRCLEGSLSTLRARLATSLLDSSMALFRRWLDGCGVPVVFLNWRGCSNWRFVGFFRRHKSTKSRLFAQNLREINALRLADEPSLQYLCRIFPWSDELLDISICEHLKIHELLG